MSNSTALDAPIGGVRHLKLFAPQIACPFKMSAHRQLQSLETLNLAFQQATGWELAIRESAKSYRHRNRIGLVDLPPIPEIAISDLSPVLPPGMPAVSRIYCEKLVEQLNELLSELGQCRRQLFATAPKTTARRNATLSTPCESIPLLESNLPFTTSNFSLTPLHTELERATCEWFIDESGIARFAAIVCLNQENRCTRELIAARSTFLAECRHGASNRATCNAIQNTVGRLFSGDTRVEVLTGTLNPLTGDVTLVGGESFEVQSTRLIGLKTISSTDVETFHLPRGQHLIFTNWPAELDAEERDDWSNATLEKLRGHAAAELEAAYECRLKDAIPSLPRKPEIALAISRP